MHPKQMVSTIINNFQYIWTFKHRALLHEMWCENISQRFLRATSKSVQIVFYIANAAQCSKTCAKPLSDIVYFSVDIFFLFHILWYFLRNNFDEIFLPIFFLSEYPSNDSKKKKNCWEKVIQKETRRFFPIQKIYIFKLQKKNFNRKLS